MIGLIQPVFHDQMEIVALVEHFAVDIGEYRLETPDLFVLLGHELLVHRGYLNEHVVFGEVEVRREPLVGFAILELDRKATRLVLPRDVVEVQEEGELPLTVVSEIYFKRREAICAQVAPASITPANCTSSGNN